MMTVTKIEGLDELTSKLHGLPQVVNRATVSGLNKIAAQGNTQAGRRIRSWYNIKAKDLKGHIVLVRAAGASRTRDERPFALIRGTGKPIPLMKFDPRPKAPPVQKGVPVKKRKAVSVKVLKQGSRKTIPGAFVTRLRKTAAANMFMRKGKARHPVRTLYSVGIAKMFEKQAVPAIDEVVRTKGRGIMQHELDFYLLKQAGMLPARGR